MVCDNANRNQLICVCICIYMFMHVHIYIYVCIGAYHVPKMSQLHSQDNDYNDPGSCVGECSLDPGSPEDSVASFLRLRKPAPWRPAERSDICLS